MSETLEVSDAAAADKEAGALALLRALESHGYHFVAVTPATHERVTARPGMERARDLRGVFGWSLPFERELLPGDILSAMERGGLIEPFEAAWKSKVRVSAVGGRLFLHSAFPTDSSDSVFLGPDSLRFAAFLRAELGQAPRVRRLVDIGAGAGVGGIVAADLVKPRSVELVDLNPAALRLARVNGAHAGVKVATYVSDGVGAVAGGFDLAIANPPFMIDEDGPVYRSGGGMNGARQSLDWTLAAASKLAPGGRLLLYTGSAIVGGRDALLEALQANLPAMGCALAYREIDPDIFGEELERPAYRAVERIAAIGAVVVRNEEGAAASAPLS